MIKKKRTLLSAGLALVCALLFSTVTVAAAENAPPVLKLGEIVTAMEAGVQADGHSGTADYMGVFDYALTYGYRQENEMRPFENCGAAGGLASAETYGSTNYTQVFVRKNLIRVSPKLGVVLTLTLKKNALLTVDNCALNYNAAANVQLTMTTLQSDGENTITVAEYKLNRDSIAESAWKHTIHAAAGDTVLLILEAPPTYRYYGQTVQNNDKNNVKDLWEITVDTDGYDGASRYDFAALRTYKAAAQAVRGRIEAYRDGIDRTQYSLDRLLELVSLCDRYAAETETLGLETDLEQFEAEAFAAFAAVPTLEAERATLERQKIAAKEELGAFVSGLKRGDFGSKAWKEIADIRAEAEGEIDGATDIARVRAAVNAAITRIGAIEPRSAGAVVGMIVGITVGCSVVVVAAVVVPILVLRKKKANIKSDEKE